jgi:hypothetical protein
VRRIAFAMGIGAMAAAGFVWLLVEFWHPAIGG